MLTYKERMDSDRAWAFHDACLHFGNASQVHKTLRRLTRRLRDLEIPYALVGAMAMFFHGYRRFTMDVDILVRPEGLERFQQNLEDAYVAIEGKHGSLLDAESGVPIDFVLSGKPAGSPTNAPFIIPDPACNSVLLEDVPCMQLAPLIDLKLAYGMANLRRLRHLADVQEMISALNLPKEFGERLHSSLRQKYSDLWEAVDSNPP